MWFTSSPATILSSTGLLFLAHIQRRLLCGSALCFDFQRAHVRHHLQLTQGGPRRAAQWVFSPLFVPGGELISVADCLPSRNCGQVVKNERVQKPVPLYIPRWQEPETCYHLKYNCKCEGSCPASGGGDILEDAPTPWVMWQSRRRLEYGKNTVLAYISLWKGHVQRRTYPCGAQNAELPSRFLHIVSETQTWSQHVRQLRQNRFIRWWIKSCHVHRWARGDWLHDESGIRLQGRSKVPRDQPLTQRCEYQSQVLHLPGLNQNQFQRWRFHAHELR